MPRKSLKYFARKIELGLGNPVERNNATELRSKTCPKLVQRAANVIRIGARVVDERINTAKSLLRLRQPESALEPSSNIFSHSKR